MKPEFLIMVRHGDETEWITETEQKRRLEESIRKFLAGPKQPEFPTGTVEGESGCMIFLFAGLATGLFAWLSA